MKSLQGLGYALAKQFYRWFGHPPDPANPFFKLVLYPLMLLNWVPHASNPGKSWEHQRAEIGGKKAEIHGERAEFPGTVFPLHLYKPSPQQRTGGNSRNCRPAPTMSGRKSRNIISSTLLI